MQGLAILEQLLVEFLDLGLLGEPDSRFRIGQRVALPVGNDLTANRRYFFAGVPAEAAAMPDSPSSWRF
jgi:hypothetical protein